MTYYISTRQSTTFVVYLQNNDQHIKKVFHHNFRLKIVILLLSKSYVGSENTYTGLPQEGILQCKSDREQVAQYHLFLRRDDDAIIKFKDRDLEQSLRRMMTSQFSDDRNVVRIVIKTVDA